MHSKRTIAAADQKKALAHCAAIRAELHALQKGIDPDRMKIETTMIYSMLRRINRLSDFIDRYRAMD